MSEVATFEEVINQPVVVAAYEVLRQAGLLMPSPRAEIFCAWCGEHIIYGKPHVETAIYEPEVIDAVAVHRANCQLFQASIAAIV